MHLVPGIAIQRHAGAPGDAGMGFERFALPLVRTCVREALELLRRHVTEVVKDVHAFVIAEQRVDPAAGATRLPLEAHQQVDRLAAVGAPIQDVAGLHQPRGAAAPFLLAIDQSGRLENRHQPRPLAVDVADGDDARAGGRFR